MCSIYLAKGMSWQEDISMIIIRFNHCPKSTKKEDLPTIKGQLKLSDSSRAESLTSSSTATLSPGIAIKNIFFVKYQFSL